MTQAGLLAQARLAVGAGPGKFGLDQISSDEILLGFFESAKVCIVCVSESNDIVAFNAGAEVMFGRQAEKALGCAFKILVPPKYHEAFDGAARALPHKDSLGGWTEQGRGPWRVVRLVRASGEEFLAEVLISFANSGGRTIASMIIRDLSDILEAENETARLAMIVAHSADAIFSLDAAGCIETWNAGAATLLGYSADEVVGHHYDVLDLRRADAPFMMEPATRSLGPVAADISVRTKNAARIEVSVRVSYAAGSGGSKPGISAIMRDISERRQRDEHMKLVMRELSHRAKNLLAVISAIGRNTAANCRSVAEFEVSFASRVRSLSNSHDLLVKLDWRGADLQQLAQSQLSPFVDAGTARCEISGSPVLLKPQAAQMIGLVLHELATNASKYGALSVAGGKVKLHWFYDADDRQRSVLCMMWQESGGPRVSAPLTAGFGCLLTDRLVAEMMDGAVQLTFAPEGVGWSLRLPAAHIAEGL